MKHIKTYEDTKSIDTVIKHAKTGKIISYDSKYIVSRTLQKDGFFIHQVLETSDTHSIIQLVYSYPPLEKKDKKPMSMVRNIFELRNLIEYESDNLEDAIEKMKFLYDTNKYNL